MLPLSSGQRIKLLFLNEGGSSGVVVKVSGYRSRGPGSIPGTTRFSEK
jgi:hypothetical protein